MGARGRRRIPCALLILIAFIGTTSLADAWDRHYRFPIKVRAPRTGLSDAGVGGIRVVPGNGPIDWEVAAGASRRPILCPSREFSFELGMRPFFSNLTGFVKALSRGGEGTLLNLNGHLRVPSENTLWEFYSNVRAWDKVTVGLAYLPWHWGAPGHAGGSGNFAGVLINQDDRLESDLNITTFKISSDYDVTFSRDLIFGPNADFQIIRWGQRVATPDTGLATDFAQTMLQPALGAHVRYEPTNTGYFSWFKPYLEGRFTWMSFTGMAHSTWDLAAGIAPPASRNLDAGFKVGYKQWKLDGSRGKLFVDVGVEGLYMDFSLRF